MSTALIQADNGSFSVQMTQEAENLKLDALLAGSFIERVTDHEENIAAVNAQMFIREALSNIEAARTAAKAPVLEYGRAIDSAAKAFVADLVAEKSRIDKLVADFAQLEIARARAAENARILEAQKIERERQAELARVQAEALATAKRLSEEARRAALDAQNAATAKEMAEAVILQREAERQAELAKATSLDLMDAVNAAFEEKSRELQEDAKRDAPAKVEGQRVSMDWEIVVTDVWMLAKHHSMCVKIEPRLSEIKELLKSGVKVHGVTAKEIVKATVTRSTLKAIDV